MEPTPGRMGEVSRPHQSTLARKYSVFTAFLLGWVAFIFFAYDLRRDSVNIWKVLLLCTTVMLVAGAIAKFTNYLLARPLVMLHRGIRSVREGRMQPVPVSRTGDEIQFLAESFNEMITALAASQKEVADHQRLLEERITQRTEALQEATQRALAASRAKSEFLANVSHELRTPLNGVLGMLEIALDEKLTTDQRDQLETAKGCANTLLALLNDILDLSKIEAGRMALEKIAFDVRAIVDECVKSQLPKARQKAIAVRATISPDLPREIIGDPLRVRQVLINLLSNAVKFTDHGHVDVRVAALSPDPGGFFELAIEVEDTGTGIPPEKLSLIFDEFTQADGSISRKYGGTGLGLAITRRLVEMHQGRITVESDVGRGSKFTVFLPSQVSSQESQPPPPQNGFSRSVEPVDKTKPRILVVEDNVINQKVVSTMLTRRGYDVHLAGNGREALAALERFDYGLVLMDVQMPEMDGMEASRLIRANPRWEKLPVIAMTAHALQGDRERCLQAGMTDFASKPVTPGRLMEIVENHLRAGLSTAAVSENGHNLPPPIDRGRAKRLMENEAGLMQGMVLLFLHLAPERLAKLRASTARLDSTGLRVESRRLRKAAERIAALEMARIALHIEEAAAVDNFGGVHEALLALEREIVRLDRHMRTKPEEQSAEPEPEPVPAAAS
ncbi:MAG: ATP-binding protein [Bryobacteraceae bacterium]